jgi:hypothetical protein
LTVLSVKLVSLAITLRQARFAVTENGLALVAPWVQTPAPFAVGVEQSTVEQRVVPRVLLLHAALWLVVNVPPGGAQVGAETWPPDGAIARPSTMYAPLAEVKAGVRGVPAPPVRI